MSAVKSAPNKDLYCLDWCGLTWSSTSSPRVDGANVQKKKMQSRSYTGCTGMQKHTALTHTGFWQSPLCITVGCEGDTEGRAQRVYVCVFIPS